MFAFFHLGKQRVGLLRQHRAGLLSDRQFKTLCCDDSVDCAIIADFSNFGSDSTTSSAVSVFLTLTMEATSVVWKKEIEKDLNYENRKIIPCNYVNSGVNSKGVLF